MGRINEVTLIYGKQNRQMEGLRERHTERTYRSKRNRERGKWIEREKERE